MAAKPRASSLPDFFAALIRTANLPPEVPPAITSKYFSAYCKQEFHNLKTNEATFLRRATRYDTFTVPRADKTGEHRRVLALVNPISQIAVSYTITKNRKTIIRIISKNGTSLYSTAEDRGQHRAFQGLDFRKRDALTAELCSEYPIVLRADISRFFYTMYTHALPWAVVGKETIKEWLAGDRRRLDRHWANKLDVAVQNCQSKETFGVPVGPDTSRVFAEILLAGVEAESEFKTAIGQNRAFRLLDDFVIGFRDHSSAKAALEVLRRVLWGYNLQLNEDKTQILQSRSIVGDRWRLEMDKLFRPLQFGKGNQRKEIQRLVDSALLLCEDYNDSRPAIWAVNILSKRRTREKNLDVLLNALLRFARDYPATTRSGLKINSGPLLMI